MTASNPDRPRRPFDPGASPLSWGWDWLDSAASAWRWGLSAQDALWTAAAGASLIEARGRERLRAMVDFARTHSRFYARRYRHLPREHWHLSQLPPVTKKELMAHFDEWVTDPAITRAGVERFASQPDRLGEPFLGRYTVWTSSGTTGTPGLFVQDPDSLIVHESLTATRFGGTHGTGLLWAGLLRGRRLAMLAATGGHFAGVVSWERSRRRNPWLADRVRTFSIMDPLPELVAALNAFDPGFVASYPSMLNVLARERERGALRIRPTALWCGGEWLVPAERTRIEQAFGCPLIEEYGSSECMSIGFGCEHGTLHVNADWVIVEPVDARYRPVAAGTRSETVLITNLANRVQPFIRYDLGDRVTLLPGRCACGSPFPSIAVEGRRDDLLELDGAGGEPVRILPLALTTVIEEQARVHRFQIVQTGSRALAVRIEPRAGESFDAAYERVRRCLQRYFTAQGATRISIRADRNPLEISPISGKLQQVIQRARR
ncbi:MAG: phenylacetate--CoA ligase family protein [Burkholderiales bacterium]|nr:MAG: phenylacetate--CoA ligase family protein [Burkholderiales bacterium]